MDDLQFNIGVLGATGYIGTPYREEIRQSTGANIVALCARRMDLLKAAQKQDQASLITNDWREVVEHPDVNLILVATPDALHYEAVMAAAAAGKHLICDKPIGMNAKEAFDMWAAYRDADKKLVHFVPYWTRYFDIFVRAKAVVESGVLGDIRGIIYRWFNPRPPDMPLTWRDDASLSAGGSIADVGSHSYDAIRWLLGIEAKRVLTHADVISAPKADLGSINLAEALEYSTDLSSAKPSGSSAQRKGTAFDYANIAWEFETGAVGSIIVSHASFLRKGLAPEVELHGTDASLGIDRFNGLLTLWREQGQVSEVVERIPVSGLGNRFEKFVFPSLRKMLTDGDTAHPNLEDGWRVQLFTDAALRSAKSGHWEDVAS